MQRNGEERGIAAVLCESWKRACGLWAAETTGAYSLPSVRLLVCRLVMAAVVNTVNTIVGMISYSMAVIESS